jgi:hypothetical protein
VFDRAHIIGDGNANATAPESAKKIQEEPEEKLPDVDEATVGNLSEEVSKIPLTRCMEN